MGWWIWTLLIGYASVLAVAAVFAVLSRTLMRPAVEGLHGDLVSNAAPLLPDVASADPMIGGQVAA